MQQRQLAGTDLTLSILGFGCAPIGSRAGFGESKRALTMALDSGITYFDTADMYGVGASEETLAKVFGGRRDRLVISTKCGYMFSGGMKALRFVKPLLRPLVKKLKGVKAGAAAVMSSQRSMNFEPSYIEQCVHGSLKRLQTDRIDLFFLHDPPVSIAQRGDVFAKLQSLKQTGKLRWYGVSCDVDVAMAVMNARGTGVSAVQVNANVLEQDALQRLLPLAKAEGVGFIARQPFAHGKLVEGLSPADAAARSSLALRFVRDIPDVASILPSMIKPSHLEANVAAINAPALSESERTFAASHGGRK
jgi:aryl-alcohol dehydrogenase-like predicted oxidoreductase